MSGTELWTKEDLNLYLRTGREPGRSKLVQHERELTVAVVEWLRLMVRLGRLAGRWTHIANERRDRIDAMLAWRMGVEAGAPDFVFFLPDAQGAAIELKRPDGKGTLSAAQREWRDDLLALGWRWALCSSINEVEAALLEWGALAKEKAMPRQYEAIRDKLIAAGKSPKEAKREAAATYNKQHPDRPMRPEKRKK